jgi:protein-tyrosine-phosphatase
VVEALQQLRPDVQVIYTYFSPSAEAFARRHGGGRVEAHSAGSRPSGRVNPRAVAFMEEVGIDLREHRSESLDAVPATGYAAVITMGCGDECPYIPAAIHEGWALMDPKTLDDDGFRAVRDEIERRVLDLLARLEVR